MTWCHRSALQLKVPKNAWIALRVVKKKHINVVLAAMGDEKMLPPMIIFKGKTDRTISDLNIPAEVIMKLQEKAWMDDHLMKVRVEDIWIKHI